jgi:hypothetical protein
MPRRSPESATADGPNLLWSESLGKATKHANLKKLGLFQLFRMGVNTMEMFALLR